MSETRQIVVPGERVADASELKPGQNTYEEGEGIYALRLGVKSVRGDRVNVIALSGRYEPARGDMVIGTVAEAGPSNWYVNIGAANDVGMHVNDVPWRVEFGETTKYLAIGDSVLLKIVHVDELKKAQVSMKDRQCRKLTGGILFEVSPAKVPRIVGRQGSMISMIKDATDVRLFVGQNGVIWLDGEPEDVALALEALRKIEAEAHTSGLTDRMKAWLEERRPSAQRTHRRAEPEEAEEAPEEREERPRRERPERPERAEHPARGERPDRGPPRRFRDEPSEEEPRPRGRPESAKKRFRREEEDEEEQDARPAPRPARRIEEPDERRPERGPPRRMRDEPERPARRAAPDEDDDRGRRPVRREPEPEAPRARRPRFEEDEEEPRPARRATRDEPPADDPRPRRVRRDDEEPERPARRAPPAQERPAPRGRVDDEEEDDTPRRRGPEPPRGGGRGEKRRDGRNGGGNRGRSRRADDQED